MIAQCSERRLRFGGADEDEHEAGERVEGYCVQWNAFRLLSTEPYFTFQWRDGSNVRSPHSSKNICSVLSAQIYEGDKRMSDNVCALFFFSSVGGNASRKGSSIIV